jgi:hypothetical protein
LRFRRGGGFHPRGTPRNTRDGKETGPLSNISRHSRSRGFEPPLRACGSQGILAGGGAGRTVRFDKWSGLARALRGPLRQGRLAGLFPSPKAAFSVD